MVEVDGGMIEGVEIECKECGKAFEVKPYEVGRRVLCGDDDCRRRNVNRRMREHRERVKERCSGCEVRKGKDKVKE